MPKSARKRASIGVVAVGLPEPVGGGVVGEVEHGRDVVAVGGAERDLVGAVAAQEVGGDRELDGGGGPAGVGGVAGAPGRAGDPVGEHDREVAVRAHGAARVGGRPSANRCCWEQLQGPSTQPGRGGRRGRDRRRGGRRRRWVTSWRERQWPRRAPGSACPTRRRRSPRARGTRQGRPRPPTADRASWPGARVRGRRRGRDGWRGGRWRPTRRWCGAGEAVVGAGGESGTGGRRPDAAGRRMTRRGAVAAAGAGARRWGDRSARSGTSAQRPGATRRRGRRRHARSPVSPGVFVR